MLEGAATLGRKGSAAKRGPSPRPAAGRGGACSSVGERGFALIGVLLLTTVMLALGVFGSRSTQIELKIAGNDVLAKKAQAAAEAGANHAFRLLKDGTPTGFKAAMNSGVGGSLASLGSVKNLQGQAYRFRGFGGARPDDGYYVHAVSGYASNQLKVISRGRVGGAERTIEVLLNSSGPGSVFQWGAFGKVSVTFSGGGGSNSYDSRLGPYSAATAGSSGNVGSNGDIGLGSADIRGWAKAGGVVKGGTVSGGITNGAPKVTLNPDPVPACGVYSDGKGMTGGKYNPATGQWTVSGGQPATLAPGTYCFSEVTLSGGGMLKVSGETKIYLTGKGTFSGGGLYNPSQKASDLQIYSSFVGNNGIVVSGTGDVFAAVYAPAANIVISGGGHFYGSYVGNTIVASGGSTLHYDEALGAGGGAGLVTLAAWHEVRNL